MFQSCTRGVKHSIQIAWISVKWCIWSLFWNFKKMFPRKRPLTFLWSSCLVRKHIFHRPAKLRHCVGIQYVKRPKFTWLPLVCLLVLQSLFYIFGWGLFNVNVGIRPYADICGVFEYVCTVYADANVLCRSQTVIEPCTENESFLYTVCVCFMCVCMRDKDICVYDSSAGVCTVINYQ